MTQDAAIQDVPQSARPRAISPLELVLLCLFVGAYVFDFRSIEKGGSWAHFVFLTVSSVSFITLFLTLLHRKPRPEVYEMGWLPIVMGVLLPAYALFGALYNNVAPGNFVRLELRYVLFFESVVLVYLLGRAGIALELIINLILISALVGVAWTIWHTTEVQGYEIAYARYRLAPIFTVSIVGISVAAMFTGRMGYVLPLLFALYAIQLSSTRSFLAGIGALYIIMHIYAIAGRERRKLIGMCLFDGVLLALLLYLYSRGYFDNWVARFVQNETAGGDATLLTRLAEYQSQWNYLSASWNNALFGGGLGSNYSRDLGVMRMAILSHHIDLQEFSTFEFGHSMWIYSAYYGGILGGWMLPFIFIATSVQSARNAFRSHRNGDRRRYLMDLQCNAVVVQVLVTGLMAHPFGSRLFCIQFGFLVALTYIYPRGDGVALATQKVRSRRRRGRERAAQSGAFS